ncbi:ribosome-binding factor A [Betaproteobacteria bacterium]|nr:ribosome-binding factor A [Betaproteobacteria bacterium]GHT97499.1 ribosome-binding factor A [Betaproteobacteria bacterium]GHU21982.1 ribosome-binding factor A [Betaproteobacteria bacterium]
MAKEYSRGQRVAEQIRRDLAEMIRLEVKDPRVGFISLSEIELTPDYAHAKVYFTSMDGAESVPGILEGLTRASGFLRRELGKRVRIHTIPELHFVYDRSVEEGSRLSQLIDQTVRADEARAHATSGPVDETPDANPKTPDKT